LKTSDHLEVTKCLEGRNLRRLVILQAWQAGRPLLQVRHGGSTSATWGISIERRNHPRRDTQDHDVPTSLPSEGRHLRFLCGISLRCLYEIQGGGILTADGRRTPRMQQPYRGRFRLLWAWLEKRYPEVLEDFKQHRSRFYKQVRQAKDQRDSRPKGFAWEGKIVVPMEEAA
jgi:hypothetical protein